VNLTCYVQRALVFRALRDRWVIFKLFIGASIKYSGRVDLLIRTANTLTSLCFVIGSTHSGQGQWSLVGQMNGIIEIAEVF